MKKIMFAISVASLFVACTKEGNKEGKETSNACPVISASSVPSVVVSAFQAKYPTDSVITWFQKDSIGYSAYFIQPVDQKKLAEFTSAGAFVSEELDSNQDGNFEDSTGHEGSKESTVCECEIPE
jgi:hypothetical protein